MNQNYTYTNSRTVDNTNTAVNLVYMTACMHKMHKGLQKGHSARVHQNPLLHYCMHNYCQFSKHSLLHTCSPYTYDGHTKVM